VTDEAAAKQPHIGWICVDANDPGRRIVKRLIYVVLVVAATMGLVAASAASASVAGSGGTVAGLPGDGHGIHVIAGRWLDKRLLELSVSSPALAKPAGVRVLVPDDYSTSSVRYPVLYLLHGGFGNFRDWTDAGDAERITTGLPLIVVMPDAGRGGWYSDWANFGQGGPPAWETFHIGELLPWVDATFRTVAIRQGRAIAGLSMGGFGAMSYAGRHPDLFSSVASFSGAVDTRNLGLDGLIFISPLIDGGAPGAIFGLPGLDQPALAGHNPWELASRFGGMHIALYTGDGRPGPLDHGGSSFDPIEFEVHSMGVAVHQRLRALGIVHTWDDYGAGTHSWAYWQRDLREELPAIMATVGHMAPVPYGPS
jgi:S-formylglutathione hydrolase FrmB